MQGIINIGLEGPLQDKLDLWNTFKIPSFYGGLEGVFERRVGLLPNWEATVEQIVATEIKPYMGAALRGVFLGDEICCHNVTCWDTALKPVTEKLRALLGKEAILYTNECANEDITEVPPEFDLISVDTYAGYKPGSNGTDEVSHDYN